MAGNEGATRHERRNLSDPGSCQNKVALSLSRLNRQLTRDKDVARGRKTVFFVHFLMPVYCAVEMKDNVRLKFGSINLNQGHAKVVTTLKIMFSLNRNTIKLAGIAFDGSEEDGQNARTSAICRWTKWRASDEPQLN